MMVYLNALLDSGAGSTAISTRAARLIDMDVRPLTITVKGVCAQEKTVRGGYGRALIYSHDMRNYTSQFVQYVPDPVGDLQATDWNVAKKAWKHLSSLEFPQLSKAPMIDLIIGCDNPAFHASKDEKHPDDSKSGDPFARLTPLGWVVIGKVRPGRTRERQHVQVDASWEKTFSARVFHANKCATYTANSCEAGEVICDESVDVLRRIELILKENDRLQLVPDPGDECFNYHEKKALDQWQLTLLQDENGRYELGLPWRDGEPKFKTNEFQSLMRLEALRRQLGRAKPADREAFQEVFREWLASGIVRVVPKDEQKPNNRYYIPYFAVLRKDKSSSQVRPVMDAKAEFMGKSLNHALLSGPNFLIDLRLILLRFRLRLHALVGDIKQMFLQIGMRKEDRAYLRFHWINDLGVTEECEFQRWPFGLTSSPSAACWVVRQHAEKLKEKFPLAHKAIMQSMMMDDVLISVRSEDEVIAMRQQLQDCLAEAQMVIRKWASNSTKLMDQIPEKDRAKNIDFEGLEAPTKLHDLAPIIKTLGIVWFAESDEFTYQFHLPEDDGKPLTNRKMLSAIMSLYDPLGFLVPYHLQARRIFQRSHAEVLEWDKPVSDGVSKDFAAWKASVASLPSVKIPRLVTRNYDDAIDRKLIMFSDASNDGVGATGYLRCQYADGTVEVALVYAKAKVTPLRSTSIPRLELEGCISALDAAELLIQAFEMRWSDVVFFSDSITALSWIRKESRSLITYVRHRVGKIHGFTSPSQWYYVGTADNPADLASRGADVATIRDHPLWWHGPTWLKLAPSEWPRHDKFPVTPEIQERIDQGMRGHVFAYNWTYDAKFQDEDDFDRLMRESSAVPSSSASGSEGADSPDPPSTDSSTTVRPIRILDQLEKHLKSYPQMVNTVAQIITIATRVLKPDTELIKLNDLTPSQRERIKRVMVTPKGFKVAERVLLRWLQAKYFHKEIAYLRKHKQLPSDHELFSLRLALDEDGILRVTSRLQYVQYMLKDERTPILIPFESPVTEAILRWYHVRRLRHSGGRATLAAEMGTRFWVPRLGLKAAKICKACQTCVLRDAKPQEFDFAPLPPSRVKGEGEGSFQVFRDVGMDLFGPFTVFDHSSMKDEAAKAAKAPAKRGRPKLIKPRELKRWIIIFTCMKVRAIHCEYLYDQSEDEVLAALDRFCLSRGTPDNIYCDRGTYFIGAEDDLRRHWFQLNEADPRLRDHYASIEFHFNPSHSPHYGGHYERLIGIVKKAMAPLFREPNLTDSMLYTTMRRAQALVNARPIAVRTAPDSADPQPITPDHFLRGRMYRRLADFDGPYKEKWAHVQQLVDHFWRRFLKECTPLYHFDRSQDDGKVTNLQVGDIVCLIGKKSAIHGGWPMAVVTDTITSPDGKVRTVFVKHGDDVEKKAIKDVLFILREPEATTLNEGGVIVVPQRYKAPLKRSKQTVSQWRQGRHLW